MIMVLQTMKAKTMKEGDEGVDGHSNKKTDFEKKDRNIFRIFTD